MLIKPQHQTAFWLIVSVALLSSLIPGGPIENRDFSHIHTGILGGFNIFLTTLDLGSLVIAYFAFKGARWVPDAAFYAAIGFFTVYAIDLAQIFPRSPTPMSFALAFIEVLGMTVAIPLMFAARAMQAEQVKNTSSSLGFSINPAYLAAALVVGIAIVWFATDSASTSHNRSEALSLVPTTFIGE